MVFGRRRVHEVRQAMACVLEKEPTTLPTPLVPPWIILPHRALVVRIFLLAGKIIRGAMRKKAGDGTRTRDSLLGRQELYQLSYSRSDFLVCRMSIRDRGARTRTADLMVPNHARYQLRYTPLPRHILRNAGCMRTIPRFWQNCQVLLTGGLYDCDNGILALRDASLPLHDGEGCYGWKSHCDSALQVKKHVAS
jgi:hypothetical protein